MRHRFGLAQGRGREGQGGRGPEMMRPRHERSQGGRLQLPDRREAGKPSMACHGASTELQCHLIFRKEHLFYFYLFYIFTFC